MRTTFLLTLLPLYLLLSTSVCVGAPEINLEELSQQIIESHKTVTRLQLTLSGIAVQKEHIHHKQHTIDTLPFETPQLPQTRSVWSAQKEIELLELEKYIPKS